MEGESLVAVCGLYCGACTLYRVRRDNNPQRLEEVLQTLRQRGQEWTDDVDCDGCLSGGRLTPYCRECKMRLCAAEKTGVTRCSDCPDFPCALVNDFNNDGVRHHAEVIDNLYHIRELGAEVWLKEQQDRWSCPQCGTSMDWYARTCFQCEAEQPYRLPRLPRDKK
jgi:predicted RNA-binding Zn-ribbon protein involved in translation (DUF1610 family)